MVATANGLKVRISKDAGACEDVTQQVGQCMYSVIRGTESLLRAAADTLHSQAGQRLLHLPGQAFVTELHHLSWNP